MLVTPRTLRDWTRVHTVLEYDWQPNPSPDQLSHGGKQIKAEVSHRTSLGLVFTSIFTHHIEQTLRKANLEIKQLFLRLWAKLSIFMKFNTKIYTPNCPHTLRKYFTEQFKRKIEGASKIFFHRIAHVHLVPFLKANAPANMFISSPINTLRPPFTQHHL